MALFKCPECEKEISNRADACPHCGYPIKGKQMPKTKEKKISNKKLTIFIGLLVVVISVLGIIIGINYSDLDKKYIRAFNNKEMTEAADIYKDISDEKDREKINTYFYKILDGIYDDFSKSKLDYEKAIARIEDIDNTGISKVHEKANEVKDKISEVYSQTLKEQIDAIYAGFKDKSITYENAIDSITAIAKDSPAGAQASLIKNSITKLNDSRNSYEEALMCIDKKDYEGALINLNKVIEDDENFKDAQTKSGEYKDNYRNVVLDKIEKETDYDKAIVIINKALDLLKNDSILTAKKKHYDELNEKKKQEEENARIEDLKNKQQLVVTNVKVDGVGFLNSNDVYVTVKNNSNKVVKSYIVGMLCFDANGYPVIPEYSIENENIEYGQCASNIQPGKTYGSRAYFTIFSDMKLYVKACVVSVEYHDGSTWENGYYDYWMHDNKSKY